MPEVRMERKLDGSWKCATEHDAELLGRYKVGDIVAFKTRKPRHGAQHRKLFSMLQLVFNNQEMYPKLEDMLDDIKLKTGHYKRHANQRIDAESGEVTTSYMYFPRSIAFDSMDQDAFELFYGDAFQIVLEQILPGVNAKELEQEVLDYENNWRG